MAYQVAAHHVYSPGDLVHPAQRCLKEGTVTLHNLELECGRTLPEASLRYARFGPARVNRKS